MLELDDLGAPILSTRNLRFKYNYACQTVHIGINTTVQLPASDNEATRTACLMV
jgi:hypothetical protein